MTTIDEAASAIEDLQRQLAEKDEALREAVGDYQMVHRKR